MLMSQNYSFRKYGRNAHNTVFKRLSQIFSFITLYLTLSRFSRVLMLKSQSHGPKPGQRGVTMLEGHHMTQRERERVSKMLFSDAICTETCFLPERPPSRQ